MARKALLYLEMTSLLNRFKGLRSHPFQSLFSLLLLILFLLSFFSMRGGSMGQYPSWLLESYQEVFASLILLSISLNLWAGLNRFPLMIHQDSLTLINLLPLTPKELFSYYLLRRLLFTLFSSLFTSYSLLVVLGRRAVPHGQLVIWMGFFALGVLGLGLSLIVYTIQKRFSNFKLLILLVVVSLLAYLLGVALSHGLETILLYIQELSLYQWPPISYFISPLGYPFSSGHLPLKDLLISLFLAFLLLFLAYTWIENPKEELIKAMVTKKVQKDVVDPDEAMLLYFGVRSSSLFTNKSFGYGIIGALFWKNLLSRERVLSLQLKYTIPSIVVISSLLGYLVSSFHLTPALILLLAFFQYADGGQSLLDLKKSIVFQFPAPWWKKLLGIMLVPLGEGIIFHLLSLGIFLGVFHYGGGGIDGGLVISLLILVIGLNILSVVLGLSSYLLSLSFIGVFKYGARYGILLFHLVLLIVLFSSISWSLIYLLLLLFVLVLYTSLWFYSMCYLLMKKNPGEIL